jgi:hypothetical protein
MSPCPKEKDSISGRVKSPAPKPGREMMEEGETVKKA